MILFLSILFLDAMLLALLFALIARRYRIDNTRLAKALDRAKRGGS